MVKPRLHVPLHVFIIDPDLQKVKALTRSSASHQAPGASVARQPRNLDPALHPFESAREYTRALNATKLERMFAAPFIAQLGKGHVDGVYTMAKDPESLQHFASGSGDGIVKYGIFQAERRPGMCKRTTGL